MKIIDASTKCLENRTIYENFKAVGIVNPLIEKAFGEGFKGNYDICLGSKEEINSLLAVARKKFIGMEVAGLVGHRQGSQADNGGHVYDGSLIAVFPQYEEEAREYIRLYENKTGKEGTIIITDRLSGLCEDDFLRAYERLRGIDYEKEVSRIYFM